MKGEQLSLPGFTPRGRVLWTVEETAHYLLLERSDIHTLIEDRLLPVFIKAGQLLIAVDDVEEFRLLYGAALIEQQGIRRAQRSSRK